MPGPPWAVPGVEPQDLPAGAQHFNISDGQAATQNASTSDAAVTTRSQPLSQQIFGEAPTNTFGPALPRTAATGWAPRLSARGDPPP